MNRLLMKCIYCKASVSTPIQLLQCKDCYVRQKEKTEAENAKLEAEVGKLTEERTTIIEALSLVPCERCGKLMYPSSCVNYGSTTYYHVHNRSVICVK